MDDGAACVGLAWFTAGASLFRVDAETCRTMASTATLDGDTLAARSVSWTGVGKTVSWTSVWLAVAETAAKTGEGAALETACPGSPESRVDIDSETAFACAEEIGAES